MSTGRQLVKNSVVQTSTFVAEVVVMFLMTPIIIGDLGIPIYGIWILLGSFLAYYRFLDLGLLQSLVRYISRNHERDDHELLERFRFSGFILFTAITAAIALATAGIYLAAPRFVPEQHLSAFRFCFSLLAIQLMFNFLARVHLANLSAFLRHDLIGIANLSRIVLTNALILYHHQEGLILEDLATAGLFGGILQSALWIGFNRMPAIGFRLSFNPQLFSKECIRELFSHSWKLVLMLLAELFRYRLDALIIGLYRGIERVAVYSIGARFIEYYVQICGTILGNMAPVFSRLEAKGNSDDFLSFWRTVSKLNIYLSSVIGFCLLFYGKVFILRWLGPDFDDAYTILCILTPSFIVGYSHIVTMNSIVGTSRHKVLAGTALTGGILNIVLSIILVQDYGIKGVAAATAIEIALMKAIIEPYFFAKLLKISHFDFYRQYITHFVIAFIPLLATGYLLHSYLEADYLRITLLAGIQILVALLFIHAVGFSKKEKQQLRLILSKKATNPQ